MVYLGVDYDEVHYETGEAPDFSRESWNSVKETLGLDFPNLPYLIDGDLKLTETHAIMKYLALKHGPQLLGGDPATAAKVEMLADVVGEMKMAFTWMCYGSDDREELKNTAITKVRSVADFLGDKDFLVGSEVCYVDFTVFEMCELMEMASGGELYNQYPTLKAHSDRVKALPRLAEFYADDEKCMKRPFNNKVAKCNNR